MVEVLLRELSNTDIDWLAGVGQRENFTAGTVLLHSGEEPDSLYLVLNGSLTMTTSPEDGQCMPTGGESASSSTREIVHLSSGEIAGETFLFNARPFAATTKAAEDAIVLTIARQELIAKLQQDVYFSAHFYRAIAFILSERLRRVIEVSTQVELANNQSMKEALFVFGELRDSDVDWLLSVGHLETIPAGIIKIQAGRPVDALSIVLDGTLSMLVPANDSNAFTLCFECGYKNASTQQVIAELSRGELLGKITFLDARPAPCTVQAIDEALVLSIPRQQLVSKLQHDMGFASRFYRILAIQLLENWESAMGLMGCPQQKYQQQQAMNGDMEYEDELDMEVLNQVSQGAARFNWMLKRLGLV